MTSPLVRRSPVHTGRVVATEALTPRMRRVTVRSETMRDVAIRPAQDVELHLQESDGRRVKRRYTIRHARPGTGELDLDVLLHGDGPGSTWGGTVRAGDAVRFQGPRGKLELTAADWHLLVGDESALPAIAAIGEAVPEHEDRIAVLEVQDEQDELPITAETHWVHRRERPAGNPDQLVAAVTALQLPGGTGQAYLLGETRTMVALRAVLAERGLAHDAIFVKGYWNLARPDRIAGRSPDPAGSSS